MDKIFIVEIVLQSGSQAIVKYGKFPNASVARDEWVRYYEQQGMSVYTALAREVTIH